MKKSRTRAAPSPVEASSAPSPGTGDGGDARGSRLPGSEERERMIAEAAYRRAEKRGFVGGDPVADWLEAEREIDEPSGGARRPGNA